MFKDLKFVKTFSDDILIFSVNMEEHSKHVTTILKRLHHNDISINFEKSQFACESVKYLGLIVKKNGITPDTRNVYDVLKIKVTTNINYKRLLDF
jgi:hypothetical protein